MTKNTKIKANNAAHPPTVPTTIPAMVPPFIPEPLLVLLTDASGAAVEEGMATVTVFTSPPPNVWTDTVWDGVVIASPEVPEVPVVPVLPVVVAGVDVVSVVEVELVESVVGEGV